MDQSANPDERLSDVRNRIDAIDTRLLELLTERFEATGQVRAIKQADGAAAAGGSPFRPAREAVLLRRLIELREDPMPLTLLVRLWRSIIASSTLAQADVQIHAPSSILRDGVLREQLHNHFGEMPVTGHDTIRDAVLALNDGTHDLVAVSPREEWMRPLRDEVEDDAAIVAALPFLSREQSPSLLVIGKAPADPTGDDETLVATAGRLPREFIPAPLWEAETNDGYHITSLPGFLSEREHPLIGLKRSNDSLALTVLGRYPSPIEISE